MAETLFITVFQALRNVFGIVFDPAARVFWLYALTSLAIALAALHWNVSRRRKGASPGFAAELRTIFDPAVWFHRSAVTDYLCFAINTVFGTVTRVFALASGVFLGAFVHDALVAANGGEAWSLPATGWALACFTLLSLLMLDLGRFVVHALMHRVPVLWEIHKVHHSAQVLTPMTSFRLHPLELIATRFVVGAFIGTASAVGLFVFGAKVDPMEILGLNIGVFAFTFLGANLRHSHIWLPYPRWLSHVLISPAQHQVHHSVDPEHYDRNFGVMFALWDWVFGTLYVPARGEQITYGLDRGEDGDYQTITNLYVVPVKKAWAVVAGGRERAGS